MSISTIQNENSNVVQFSHYAGNKKKVSLPRVPSWLSADMYIKARMTEIALIQVRLGNEEADLNDLNCTGTH